MTHADHLDRAADETECLSSAQAFSTRAVALVRLGMAPEDAANAARKDHPYCTSRKD